MNLTDLLERVQSLEKDAFEYRLRTKDVVRLRKKYWEHGFDLTRFLRDCYQMGLVPELVLRDLLDPTLHRKEYSPLIPILLRIFPGNDEAPTYDLSSVPLSNYPRNISRTHDGCVLHPAKIRWAGMNSRCIDPTNTAFANYGMRGIRICDAWHYLNPMGRANYCRWFGEELRKLGLTSDKGIQVDRRDNDGPYCPENCRLVSNAINAQNTRTTKLSEELVVNLRNQLRETPPEKRGKVLAASARSLSMTYQGLQEAVDGSTWKNVDSVSSPVDVGRFNG